MFLHAIELAPLADSADRSSIDRTVFAFMFDYQRLAPAFKHQSFAEEEEWRLISSPTQPTDSRIGFRATESTLIPHLNVKLELPEHLRDMNGKKNIGIEMVRIGPTPTGNRRDVMFAVSDFLDSRNVAYGSISHSNAPYRTSM